MKKTTIFLVLAFATFGVFYEVMANLNGASSTTGAPGETTCSQSGCHGAGNGEYSSGGLADNFGGGSVTISGVSGTYVPGTLYHITVHVAQLGATRFGFNCELLNESFASTGALTITQSGTWLRSGINGTRQGVSQGHSGAVGPTAGAGLDYFDFTFDWTAPSSSVGPITIYATGIAANNNGLNDSGDQVYYGSITLSPSVAPTAQILLSRTSFNFPSFYALPNSTGNMQEFWTAGQALTGNLTVSVTGSQFQIATSAAGPWMTSIPLTATSGIVNGTAIYIQYTGPASGTQTGTVTVSGGGATSQSIPLSGAVKTGATAPTLSAGSPASLNFGTLPVGNGPCTAQSFSFTYTNPVAPFTITAPAGYEVSTVATRDFQTTLTPAFAGVGFSPTVFVRLKNQKTPGAYNGNVTITMAGATTQSVAVTASVTVPSQVVLTSVDDLPLFTTTPGTPSATQTLNVTGSGLTSSLDISTSTNFEVSLSPGSGFGSSVSIINSGTVTPTTLYVRYSPTAAGLDYGGLYAYSGTSITETVTINGASFGASTDVKETTKTELLNVYPNPSGGPITVNTNLFPGRSLIITDINGKQVYHEKVRSAYEVIDLSMCTNGIYFLSVVEADKKVLSTQKVILRK